MKRVIGFLLFVSIGVASFSQQYNPAVTPDTIPDGGSRKALRRGVNWSLVAHDAVRDSITDLRTDVQVNSAKVTNANHSGDVAGDGILVIQDDAVQMNDIDASGTADGTTYLRGDGSWAVPAGSGDVAKVGTPVNNQLGVWTGDGTIEGDADVTWDGSDLNVLGNITITGLVDGIDIGTAVPANTAKVTNATHSGDVVGSTSLVIQDASVQIDDIDASGSAGPSTYLRGDGQWFTPTGSGDVAKSTTPTVNNQIAVWIGPDTIEGTNDLTWNETTLSVLGNITTPGLVDGVDISAFKTSYDAHVADTTELDAVAMLIADPKSYTFGMGMGLATDTAGCEDEAFLGGFYHHQDTLKGLRIDAARAWGTAPTVNVKIVYDVNPRDATPTTVWTNVITSTPQDVTTFTVDIPPGVHVRAEIDGTVASGDKATMIYLPFVYYIVRE